ncbi:MAG: hypothetical protein M0014_02790 [Actinomycetota bacterium]|jgi:MinD-like ATPase involved in chromosome partitioning or flagellar assembly|nr:hypothetical protein [Actinomycetota bacterium]
MLISVCSLKGSPGVTTVAAGLALTWPGDDRFIAECDPSGGDLGSWARVPTQSTKGVGPLIRAVAQSSARPDLNDFIVDVYDWQGSAQQGRGLPVLLGLDNPDHVSGDPEGNWNRVARAIVTHPGVVIADAGRVQPAAQTQRELIARSAVVLVVVQPSIEQARYARARLPLLTSIRAGGGHDASTVRLVVIGEKPYHPSEFAGFLADAKVPTPVAAQIPFEPDKAGPHVVGAEPKRQRRSRVLGALAALAVALEAEFVEHPVENKEMTGAATA